MTGCTSWAVGARHIPYQPPQRTDPYSQSHPNSRGPCWMECNCSVSHRSNLIHCTETRSGDKHSKTPHWIWVELNDIVNALHREILRIDENVKACVVTNLGWNYNATTDFSRESSSPTGSTPALSNSRSQLCTSRSHPFASPINRI